MLGGVTRMTISITVLVMEGSGALQLTGPLMVAVFVAKMVGDALTPSIYDVHIKIRGAPVLVSASLACPARLMRVYSEDIRPGFKNHALGTNRPESLHRMHRCVLRNVW